MFQAMWAGSMGGVRGGFNTVITRSVTEHKSPTATWPCSGEVGQKDEIGECVGGCVRVIGWRVF